VKPAARQANHRFTLRILPFLVLIPGMGRY
jgi:hypothetical protein